MSWKTAWEMLQVNVEAVVHLSLAFLPAMKKRDAGHIINIGSISGSIPSQGIALYGATKSFLDNFSTALHRELTGTHVHVSVVRAGAVKTEFSETALAQENGGHVPTEHVGISPEHVAWRIWNLPVMTGSGANTPTRRQIEIIKAWGINVILGFRAYLRHMALVARDELGIDPHSLKIRLLGTHLGMEDRKVLQDLWGAPAYDIYGTHESGMLGAECRHQSGLHVMEDAFVLEIADPETGRILPDGEKGTIYITTLYKYGARQIRFNVNDLSAFHTGSCPCGNTQRRLKAIYGRNDSMIKLRGVNVFPEAIGTYPIGLDTEVCSSAALDQAWKEARQPYQREHVMPYLYDHSPILELSGLPAGEVHWPEGDFKVLLLHHDPDYGTYRWTVDTAADLDLLRLIYTRFGGRADFTWLEVLELFQKEPELAAINADVEHNDRL